MGREQQGSLQVRSGWTGTGPQELVRFQSRTPQRPPSQLPTQETERALPRAPPVSWPPPSPELPTAGSSPSPSRSNGPSGQQPRDHRGRRGCRHPPPGRALPWSDHRQPRVLDSSLRKLRRLNRQLARRKIGSKRRSQSRARLARVHARAANLRRVEQLNLAGMARNRRLARALADAGLGELRRRLTYKTTWYGSRLIVADRFYPSSKSCSACGWVKAKLTLAERTFACEACELRLDRDLNAARNLVKLAEHVAQGGWETQNARGADRKTQPAGRVAMKRESSSQDVQ